MSIAAAEHFGEMAQRYGIEANGVLLGNPVQLMPEGMRLSLHLFDDEIKGLPLLKAQHKNVVTNTYPFLAGVVEAVEADLPRIRDHGTAVSSARAAGAVWPKLRPAGYRTGRVEDFTVEALVADEIPEPVQEKLETARQRLGNALVEGCEIFLLTSARLHAGRLLGRVGCVTKITMGYANKDRTAVTSSVSVVGMSLPVNDSLRASGEWQSRAIGRLLYGAELRRPYQGGLPTMGKDGNLGGSGHR